MDWSFEVSLMVFLVIAFVSQWIAGLTKSKLSLPFVLGVICIGGFALNIFPKDFVQKSKLIEVGTIAFNVLIIHSGSMFNLRHIKKNRKAAILVFTSVVVMTMVIVFGLRPLIGKEVAYIAPSSMIGGGASCAIGSIGILKKAPQFSSFPWLVFMFQSLFSLPLFVVMLKKEKSKKKKADVQATIVEEQCEKKMLCERIPKKYRTPAFYLAMLMVISVANRWLNSLFLADLGISITMSALIIGMVLGQLGIIERAPLKNSDSFGLLMIGLMSLMANSFAHTPLNLVLSLLIPLLWCFVICTLILVIIGILMSKPLGFSKNMGVLLAVSTMVSFPINTFIIKGIYGGNQQQDSSEISNLISKTNIGSLYIVNIFSVLIISIMLNFV